MNKLLADTWIVFRRNVLATLRDPAWTIIGLFQPICFLVLFAPLLNSVAGTPGFPGEDALDLFIPGLLVMIGLYGTAFVGFGLVSELRDGLIERLSVTPVSRAALLLGRALRDILALLVQSILVVIVTLPFGFRADVAGLAVLLGMLVILGLLMASFSYALAMAFRSEDALAPTLNTFALPLVLLSGIYLPMTLAPGWLQVVAMVNPLLYAVDAARALVDGEIASTTVFVGFAVLAVLAVLASWWAVRSFRRAAA